MSVCVCVCVCVAMLTGEPQQVRLQGSGCWLTLPCAFTLSAVYLDLGRRKDEVCWGCFAAVLNAWGLLVRYVAKGDVECPRSGEGTFSDHLIFFPAPA